jgi:hypothetical protein
VEKNALDRENKLLYKKSLSSVSKPINNLCSGLQAIQTPPKMPM